MQFDQTVLSKTSITFPPEQHTCPHCRTPIQQTTNDIAIQILMAQFAEMKEMQAALASENKGLKKMLQESEDYGLETERMLNESKQIGIENAVMLKESNETLRYLKAQKVK